MPIDRYNPDRHVEQEFAPRRAPRCYARPATADAAPSRINVENVALAFALVAVSCAVFLILSQGWSL
jgi:hypothetical protein